MLKRLKKLLGGRKSLELELIDVIKRQQDFISKNIQERVVYVGKGTEYTNIDRFEDPNAENEDELEEYQPEEITPETLTKIIEEKNKEG